MLLVVRSPPHRSAHRAQTGGVGPAEASAQGGGPRPRPGACLGQRVVAPLRELAGWVGTSGGGRGDGRGSATVLRQCAHYVLNLLFLGGGCKNRRVAEHTVV